MDEHRRKSIQRKTEAIFKKAEEREKAGGDYFETGWQATLELMLLLMEEQLIENPGCKSAGMMSGIFISM